MSKFTKGWKEISEPAVRIKVTYTMQFADEWNPTTRCDILFMHPERCKDEDIITTLSSGWNTPVEIKIIHKSILK